MTDRAVFNRVDDEPDRTQRHSNAPPLPPLRKGGKTDQAPTTFPPLRRGGRGGESRGACNAFENRPGPGICAAWPAWLIGLGLAGQALAVAAVHPFELTYFNVLAGGPLGGRHILSDSNLDWGQGLKGLARLQCAEPEFRDLTLYYLGDTDPAWYGVEGMAHVVNAVDDYSQLPEIQTIKTRYLAVSASLQWGPWGPPGFFRKLDSIAPIRMTEDTTIAIYRSADLRRVGETHHELIIAMNILVGFTHPTSIKVASARQPVLQSIGHFGNVLIIVCGSRVAADSTARFSMTTKYSSPRRTRMAKWPSLSSVVFEVVSGIHCRWPGRRSTPGKSRPALPRRRRPVQYKPPACDPAARNGHAPAMAGRDDIETGAGHEITDQCSTSGSAGSGAS